MSFLIQAVAALRPGENFTIDDDQIVFENLDIKAPSECELKVGALVVESAFVLAESERVAAVALLRNMAVDKFGETLADSGLFSYEAAVPLVAPVSVQAVGRWLNGQATEEMIVALAAAIAESCSEKEESPKRTKKKA